VHWNEIPECEPDDFTMDTMPARFAEIGDLHAAIDDHPFDIAPLLEWAERDEAAGEQAPSEPEDAR
jgi:DNA primase